MEKTNKEKLTCSVDDDTSSWFDEELTASILIGEPRGVG